ncbi:phage/plasmid primase, P4 family [uncultured Lacticaseibacillus sp.]|jgi:putative DNA primase/helicase|uniref:DNA primase family protein n=1 Tax=uncultured Lacticaseibacillus sp. TaxID=2775882 RepID=UPI002594AD68|nr:DNA primase family protein [uncultured Lacticaseibacillus sp.]
MTDVLDELASVRERELTPFNVHHPPFSIPDEATEEDVANAQKQLKVMVPRWLKVTVSKKIKKDPNTSQVTNTLSVSASVNELEYLDDFKQHTRLEVFPALQGGAIYQPDKGTWRVFAKGELATTVNSRVTRELISWGVYKANTVSAIYLLILRTSFNEAYGRSSPFDENSHPELVAFNNGTYDILTNTMQANSADNYMMSSHDYDVDSTNNDAPEWDKLLNAVFGDGAITIKEFIGYTFYRSYAPFQEMLWLYGPGGEGKSTILGYIQRYVIGQGNYSSVKPDALADSSRRFETANLYGKDANIMADVGNGYLKTTDILKSLTGGDSISAEFKGLQNFTFINHAKLIFSTNELPAFSDHTSGFADRILVVKTINGDTRKNREWWNQFNTALIKKQAPAFAMNCMQLFNKALKRSALSRPQSVIDASQEWLKANDHLKEFLDECATIDLTDNKGESTTIFRNDYSKWCGENGYLDKTTSQTIAKRLAAMGIKKVRSTNGYSDGDRVPRYIGVHLATEHG